MGKEGKLQLLKKIKRMEQELYLKKSQLVSAEALEQTLSPSEYRKIFLELIKKIGLCSSGGNSVEEIKRER